jgi:Fe-S cluster biogenesis protein NfuA
VSRKFLRNVDLAMSGACPTCGDVLLTPALSANGGTVESLQDLLDQMFQNHVREKHSQFPEDRRVRTEANES